MNLSVGQIVWARRQKDDIYWPGKITIISNNTNDLWSTNMHYDYLVQFFVTNQSIWTIDVLPYREYRDSMANDSFIDYGLLPTIKQDFLNAIYQADQATNQEMYANTNSLTTMAVLATPQEKAEPMNEDNIDNDFLLTPVPIYTSNTDYYSSSIPSTTNSNTQSLTIFSSNDNSNHTTQPYTTMADWYNQQGLIVESITPPLPTEIKDQPNYSYLPDHFQQTTSISIITTKSYANSPFISFLSNTFSNFPHHSIIYIDDNSTFTPHHPLTSNTYYLICFDHFDSTIQQQLDSTILNNLNASINYLFVILNAPSNELVKHLYSNVMDKRTIVVVHYHTTFDNEPLLLCSGNRSTFEMIEKNILKYLCTKIKYIESQNEVDEQIYSAYCVSSLVQSSNILHRFVNKQIHQTLNEHFDEDFQRTNANVLNELFPRLSITKSSNQDLLLDLIENSNEEIIKNPSKQITIMTDVFENGAIKTRNPPPVCEYYLQEILHKK